MTNKYLELAYKEALKAYELGECPIGAVVVYNDKVIAKAHNLRENKEDPLGHAEILAIKKASKKLGVWRLDGASLYVTLEPCVMCAGAIINSRIKEVYFGAEDPRNGAVKNNLDTFNAFTHKVKYQYLDDKSCSQIITNFFKDLRFNIDITNFKLETKRLLLRPFLENDLYDLYEYAKEPGVGELAGWKHHENILETKKVLEMFIKDKEVLAIYHKESQKVIGSIGIHKRYYPEFGGLKYREIGYTLSKNYWQKGLMTEALDSLIPRLFNEFKLDVLVCCHSINNIRSEKVINKQKFIYYKNKTLKGEKLRYYYLLKEDN